MFSREEIRDFFNKGYKTQAYKAIVAAYAQVFERLDFKVAFAKLKEELGLPLIYNTLYMTYYRKRKEKERGKKAPGEQQPLTTPKATVPEKEDENEAALRAKLDQLDERNQTIKQWDF